MFCKKLFLVSILITLCLFITSCKKESYSFLGYSKVEITSNLYFEKPRLELFIFSTKDYHSLEINNKYIDYLNYQRQDINLLIDNIKVEGYLHYFDISLKKQELVISEISLKHQNKIYEVNIGLYQSIYLEPSNNDILSSCDIYNNKGKINYQNNLYKPIYLKEIKNISINKNHQVKIMDISKQVIYSHGLKTIEVFSLDIKEKYHQIGGIIKTSVISNFDEYKIYTTYYYSLIPSIDKLQNGIDINQLEIIN